MSANGSTPTSQSFTPFWMAGPGSPATPVVGTPVANPVPNADLQMGGPGGVNTVAPAMSQDITTMANAVPHDDFSASLTEGQQTQQPPPPTAGAVTAIPVQIQQDPTVRTEVMEEPRTSTTHMANGETPAVPDATPACSSGAPEKYFPTETQVTSRATSSRKIKQDKEKGPQRRRLTPGHREMIIDLVFNEKKTSREVGRYMGLPQSTVMSVVQVFKKEHRIHKKVATGRKRRLTTAQEFQLFEMSQERDSISIDEIRYKFLEQYPEFKHISKTTIYRTLERGKKGLIGMEQSVEKFVEPQIKKNGRYRSAAIETAHQMRLLEPSVTIMEDTPELEAASNASDKEAGRHRRSLSIAEREMIISLFFNENRTIREVADFMHLAKSTVSSVVQVFKKEHRIQRKTSTGRKKKLSDDHQQMIMNILSDKEDMTIEETRNKFLSLNPDVPNISKSTIYRIMENCQSKLQRSRSDLEVFVGTFIHSTDDDAMIILPKRVMGVLNARIEFMESVEELDHLKAEYEFTDSNICYMNQMQFMIPGFVDTHIHASQLPNNGVAMDLPLLEWLQTYTFPTEANFSDTLFAREVYTKAVERLLRNGTTTASYYATIHLEGTKILADVVHDKGQRALIGKVNMLRNCPEYYREHSVNDSIRDTEEFLHYVNCMQSSLVNAVITPRFAPTCPEDQLSQLGQLANKYKCSIQSHLSETQPECNWVKELFPWSKSYTDVYDRTQLLNEKSIMAHCIWLSDDEIYTLRERGVGIAHCPNSNISIRSGLCDVKRLMAHGLKIGLGTDCSGGYSSSIFDAMRHALQTSNVLALQHERDCQRATANMKEAIERQDYQCLTYKDAFKLATLGGAKVLGMEDKIGNFEIEKEFDALLIDVAAPGSPIDVFSKDTFEEKIQKFIYNGDDRNIAQVYVAGRRIYEVHNKALH